MNNQQQHQSEVQSFLQKQFSNRDWEFTLPHGYGNETYFAHGNGQTYFVKLGAPVSNYQAVASIGLTPPLIATGYLEDGTSILVQSYITGRKPSRKDYRDYLEQIAAIIDKTHHSPELRSILPDAPSVLYNDLASESLSRVQQRWEQYKAQVPAIATQVDENLANLMQLAHCLPGAGVVTSHNDICNANWLIASDGNIYLIDLDSMSMDDPACDIGATLWWYYPPGLRQRFLEIVGYAKDEQFEKRMHVRMAIHCLSITLPRVHSFDRFDPENYAEALTDFWAILAGRENPQGYD